MAARVVLPDPAAVLPGEADLLAGVTADLSDHAPKLVYADWLEERDDPRGPHLRQLVRALRDGDPLPGSGSLSVGWLETVGTRLLERIRRHDLEPYRDQLLPLAPPGTELELLKPPKDLDENQGRPKPPATFTVRESLDLPSANEQLEEELGDEAGDQYWDLLLAQRAIAPVLFGYARPRHLCSDPIPGSEWQQLISLTSDEDRGWGWGDGHELFWYIRTADLKAGRFDRTRAESG